MTDPNTPTTPTSNPQDLIDQALGGTPAPTVMPDPTPAVTEPTLPTPEPLTPPVAVVEAPPMSTEPILPPAETVPTELTSAPVTPMMEEPPVDTKPMGEDMPLAFAAATPVDTVPTKAPETYIEPVNSNAVVPPILTAPSNDSAAPKKKSKKIVGLMVGILAFLGILGIGGLVSYQMYGAEAGLIAYVSKFVRDDSGNVVRNPDWDPNAVSGGGKTQEEERNESLSGSKVVVKQGNKPEDQESCNGCLNGGWMVWRDGECKITGICGSDVPGKDTENPVLEQDADKYNSKNSCNGSGKGYVWCESVDSAGKSYAFCNTSGSGCNQAAIDKGYTIQIGKVECAKAPNDLWLPTQETLNSITGANTSNETKLEQINAVKNQCIEQAGSFTALGNKEMWICPVGTTVACTKNVQGAKRFYGNPANGFCGVIQVDTGTGHTSYSSTESCDEPEATPNPSTPTVTTNPILMCSNLTRTPTTTPVIGDKLTFTCVGASVPAGSVNLSYKFRYSLNSGAYLNLTNKTPTTSELTIAACGTYSVECQACGTINGVLTCDPTWAGATTQ